MGSSKLDQKSEPGVDKKGAGVVVPAGEGIGSREHATKSQEVSGARKKTDAELISEAMARPAQERDPAWNPEEIGDAIVGTLLSMQHVAWRKEGDAAERVVLVLRVSTPEGTRSVWCNRLLERQIDESGLTSGQRLAICYRGQVELRNGFSMNLFTIAVD